MTAAAGGPAAFPWREAMAAGLGTLRLPPSAFWAMTPRELAAALTPPGTKSAPIGRDDLARLMARFPDRSS
ncbi:rcc01693 family protein [Propylenella binzhouense]|uniref:Phage tail assembly chaperone n=1 Tax=Propylenella binzhouense TaxID=2555902 RepID=A0A964WVS1_9HYPH|nr:rcc01693 family protein [Propylenella binzhouense]MYZ50343.1 phage tail assembly chaperone [Propylenella binzhouense]